MMCAGCPDCVFLDPDIPPDMHEIHVTVRTNEPGRFKALSDSHGIKTIIVGYNHHKTNKTLTDPMTSVAFQGTEKDCLHRARDIAEKMRQWGFTPIRTKIETTPTNPIAREGAGYFESHLAVTLPRSELGKLKGFARQIGMHLSRNAFKDQGETVTYMITKRADARSTTPEKFQLAMELIREQCPFEVDKLIVEFCWFDSNKDHDIDWMGKG